MVLIRILSFNACVLPYPLTNTWDTVDDRKEWRLREFFNQVSDTYDILLLQEVWDTNMNPACLSMTTLVRNLAYENGFDHIFFIPCKWNRIVNNGLVIVSKYPIIKTSEYTFQYSAGLQWFIPNGALYAKIQIPGNNESMDSLLDVFVTHIHAGSLDTSFRNSENTAIDVQKHQIDELKTFIDTCTTNVGGKWVIAGDFNCDASHPEECEQYIYLKSRMGCDSLLEPECPSTYPVYRNVGTLNLVNPAFIGKRTCVDHCFTNTLDAHARVIELVSKDDIPLSDHAGIHIEMTV